MLFRLLRVLPRLFSTSFLSARTLSLLILFARRAARAHSRNCKKHRQRPQSQIAKTMKLYGNKSQSH